MRNKYTKEMLEPVVAKCYSWAEVCRQIGVKPFTGSQTYLKKRCIEMGIDDSHFKGQSWNKGKTFGPRRPIEEYLSNEQSIKSSSLRVRLISEGFKQNKCQICGLSEWNGENIPLELDHINSDHWDNSLENLQIICPNCHAQETVNRRRASMVKQADTRGLDSRAARRAGSNPARGTCKDCDTSIDKKATRCRSCAKKLQPTKIEWPDNDSLRTMVEESNFSQVSKRLGVSDNAIRKRLRR